ncbi:hypothetical protein, partial [Marinobacter sp.]|uniref:hypothetical protein n=1 Tax=Marinobacter sp. TaxID=50741 RepID=UPI003F9A7C13
KITLNAVCQVQVRQAARRDISPNYGVGLLLAVRECRRPWMADDKRQWVRQAFMKRSFMRSRTTAICDCWPDPAGVLVAVPGQQEVATPFTKVREFRGKQNVSRQLPSLD